MQSKTRTVVILSCIAFGVLFLLFCVMLEGYKRMHGTNEPGVTQNHGNSNGTGRQQVIHGQEPPSEFRPLTSEIPFTLSHTPWVKETKGHRFTYRIDRDDVRYEVSINDGPWKRPWESDPDDSGMNTAWGNRVRKVAIRLCLDEDPSVEVTGAFYLTKTERLRQMRAPST